jgi:type IV secretion system protein TrbL
LARNQEQEVTSAEQEGKMGAPAGSILPQSFFDALSTLWGVTAYVAASIVAAGVALSGWTNRDEPNALLRLLTKVILIGLATACLREWLIRFGDIVNAFGSVFQIDPRAVDEKFIHFLAGSPASNPKVSAWDVIWNTGSVGAAFAYAMLWVIGWISFGVQFIVKLVGDILLSAGWALSPLFLACFLLRPMAGVALKYILGLVVLVCWPFGWVLAGVVTDAMLDRAAAANLVTVLIPGGDPIGPILTVLLIGLWMIVSSITAPYVLYRVLTSGANPAAAFAHAVGGVMQGTLIGGAGAATAAVTGGAAAPAVIAAAALGAMAGGTESSARGGGFPSTTATGVGAAAGLYRGRFVRRQTGAMEDMAAAQTRNADAAEEFNSHLRRHTTRHPNQPHRSDPNQAAIEIEAHAKS